MAHILVHHKVEDYKTWKPVFDGHSSFRAENGSLGGKVFRSADDPNDVFVLLEFQNVEIVKKFAQSDGLKEAMKNAGVVSIPQVYFLEEAASVVK